MNCVPRDHLARLTRASQLVINTGHYQPFKHPHVTASPPLGVEKLSGVFMNEILFILNGPLGFLLHLNWLAPPDPTQPQANLFLPHIQIYSLGDPLIQNCTKRPWPEVVQYPSYSMTIILNDIAWACYTLAYADDWLIAFRSSLPWLFHSRNICHLSCQLLYFIRIKRVRW